MTDPMRVYKGIKVYASDAEDYGETGRKLAAVAMENDNGESVIRVFQPEFAFDTVLNHEVAHIKLGHCKNRTKDITYGEYSTHEAQAWRMANKMGTGHPQLSSAQCAFLIREIFEVTRKGDEKAYTIKYLPRYKKILLDERRRWGLSRDEINRGISYLKKYGDTYTSDLMRKRGYD